jgi:hypothetical protein
MPPWQERLRGGFGRGLPVAAGLPQNVIYPIVINVFRLIRPASAAVIDDRVVIGIEIEKPLRLASFRNGLGVKVASHIDDHPAVCIEVIRHQAFIRLGVPLVVLGKHDRHFEGRNINQLLPSIGFGRVPVREDEFPGAVWDGDSGIGPQHTNWGEHETSKADGWINRRYPHTLQFTGRCLRPMSSPEVRAKRDVINSIKLGFPMRSKRTGCHGNIRENPSTRAA